ncbi:MAG: DJ-1/PfpI family protein [Tannerellaceae bacterium]|nr:DJ-1/PfpI family protein [Tannerellaceae bacterium]
MNSFAMKKVAVILFDCFETLDVFGSVEIVGRLPEYFEIDYYSLEGGIKTSTQGVRIATKKTDSITGRIDVLLIPGGKGTRREVENDELIRVIARLSEQAEYTLTICTGSALLAKTNLLDGKTATSNKRAFDWVVSTNKEVHWKRKARWTVDEKYYTSSGISAGMDMTLGFVSDLLGLDTANRIAQEMEYEWNNDPENDLFEF